MRELVALFPLSVRLCCQDLQGRFAGSFLGGVWLFIWPLVQMFIYIVIFGKMMGARLGGAGQSYGLYVAAGLLAWSCFAGTLQRTARAFVDRRNVIGKVEVDLRVFPLAICLAELLPFAAAFVLLVLVALFMGWQPSSLILWMLFALYCQQLLAMGLGLLLACCAAFARDVVEVVAIALQMAFWFTPIVYVPSILPDWVAWAVQCNPMTQVVAVYQHCFVFGGHISLLGMAYVAIVAHLSAWAGLHVLRRLHKDIRDVL
ncbi:MAG: ABC transporter permease [Desulfovibrio sp.]|nr:ABC transporter permease [Desulfovibrio sp.]